MTDDGGGSGSGSGDGGGIAGGGEYGHNNDNGCNYNFHNKGDDCCSVVDYDGDCVKFYGNFFEIVIILTRVELDVTTWL